MVRRGLMSHGHFAGQSSSLARESNFRAGARNEKHDAPGRARGMVVVQLEIYRDVWYPLFFSKFKDPGSNPKKGDPSASRELLSETANSSSGLVRSFW